MVLGCWVSQGWGALGLLCWGRAHPVPLLLPVRFCLWHRGARAVPLAQCRGCCGWAVTVALPGGAQGAVQSGQLKVPPGYHPLDVEKEWGKLHVAVLEREKLLRAEFER